MEIIAAKAIYYLSSPFTWYAFVLGSLIGSFLNVCILRIPEGTFWKNQRSVCPQCQAPIPFYYNIPILSYFILRGKTSCCKNPLSKQYPAVEFFTALTFTIIYWNFPVFYIIDHQTLLDNANLIRFFHGVTFASLLITCSVIDLRLKIIPDVISLPMILLTPVVFYLHPDLDWKSSLIGVFAGGGILFGIAWLYWLLRKQVGMGMGDVKLLAAIGGWLGYQSILPTVFYSSLTGAFVGIIAMAVSKKVNTTTEIPFGPFLAGGAILHLLYGSKIQELFLLIQ